LASSSQNRPAETGDIPSAKRAKQVGTIDPTEIQNPSQIPPKGATYAGVSSQGSVDIYFGTINGDLDAQQAAKELLSPSPETGGQSNADHIYNQVSAINGGVQLPGFRSLSGKNVESIVFVSGSSNGPYGAFHIPGSQIDFDRIVVDSLNISGTYSAGSGLSSIAPVSAKIPCLFPIYRGVDELLTVTNPSDQKLKSAKLENLREALKISRQNLRALESAVETGKTSLAPARVYAGQIPVSSEDDRTGAAQLARTNRDTLDLISSLGLAAGGRQHLSTGLFAAELVECFETLTGRADPGRTDGEALSRVLAYKMAPEIALVPGFNSAVTQQWWSDGHPDYANDDSQSDQSADGNGAGVMFLEFLTDYLGVPVDRIIQHMPSSNGAPLGQTYANLLSDNPQLTTTAGSNGPAAFQKMVFLLQRYYANSDGSLNLPANGNPFIGMPGSKQGGLTALSKLKLSTAGVVSKFSFSPNGGTASDIIAQLNGAHSTIEAAIYSFTNTNISQALLAAKSRGVQVTVIMDKSQTSGSQATIHDALVNAGITVRLSSPPGGIMHNKFMIIDGSLVETGSYNYTNRAEASNYENSIWFSGSIVQAYETEFTTIYSTSQLEATGLKRSLARLGRRLHFHRPRS